MHEWHADELGPAEVVHLRPMPGMEAVVVVDNLALGPAIGGVRLTPTVSTVEVARLARAMTLKNAAAGLPHGGGKAGIRRTADLDGISRERLMRAFARAIAHLTDYIPGPDMGTDESCMAIVHDEIGRAVGLPSALGGIPLDEVGATGYGLACCADALALKGLLVLEGADVVIEGFGAVGTHAALALAERGARVIGVSDSRGAVFNEQGLDVPKLVAFKRQGDQVAAFPGGVPRTAHTVGELDCDILVPAAQADVFDRRNAARVNARVILQGANLPATADAERIFHGRGVLSIPDIIANAGGVICAAVEHAGGSRTQAFAAIAEKIGDNVAELLDRTSRENCLPRQAAQTMALARIRAASGYRRSF
ncbi:Glu/Leu/Phe/Val family dehydrogenase [Nonomuraea soli]|uniref:Glutamate dehydrogenase n=1 Tax=Nonomuraea soli TaxID=1032476 RepID=A0A7W0CF48_9ACTN|nr:Glu/Leu/Phe/Val dehydrogenase [Nonomuraea soli]MBA2890025.1 glutamate dehydrogenase/leucine dehydrogenase [Nonomuraea soli]